MSATCGTQCKLFVIPFSELSSKSEKGSQNKVPYSKGEFPQATHHERHLLVDRTQSREGHVFLLLFAAVSAQGAMFLLSTLLRAPCNSHLLHCFSTSFLLEPTKGSLLCGLSHKWPWWHSAGKCCGICKRYSVVDVCRVSRMSLYRVR